MVDFELITAMAKEHFKDRIRQGRVNAVAKEEYIEIIECNICNYVSTDMTYIKESKIILMSTFYEGAELEHSFAEKLERIGIKSKIAACEKSEHRCSYPPGYFQNTG